MASLRLQVPPIGPSTHSDFAEPAYSLSSGYGSPTFDPDHYEANSTHDTTAPESNIATAQQSTAPHLNRPYSPERAVGTWEPGYSSPREDSPPHSNQPSSTQIHQRHPAPQLSSDFDPAQSTNGLDESWDSSALITDNKRHALWKKATQAILEDKLLHALTNAERSSAVHNRHPSVTEPGSTEEPILKSIDKSRYIGRSRQQSEQPGSVGKS